MHDVIRPSDPSDRCGALWRAGAGDYGVFARRLSGVDSAGVCRCGGGDVAGSSDGAAGIVRRTDRHHELSDCVVNHRLRLVRRSHRTADKTVRLESESS